MLRTSQVGNKIVVFPFAWIDCINALLYKACFIEFCRRGHFCVTHTRKLGSGSYFVVPVEPGAHQYVVHSEAKDVLNIEVEPGETYYVIGTVTMGFMAGHPNLSPSDQATFDGMFDKLKRAE